MNKREVSEIKRRLKKEHVSFSCMAGCYVDGDRNKVCTFQEPFLNLPDDEFFKYLEIANKVLSGTIGNNLLNLEFPMDAEMPGGHQQFLMGIRESKLQNEELLNAWYDLVIEKYQLTGNYLILLFMDAYDVMKKTTDDLKIDESEEVFTYMLAAICPVELSKPGLGYLEEEKRIGVRMRDWVVGAPESGFLFPAFNNRSTDIHSLLFYSRNPKEPHREMMEEILGCGGEKTAAEKKMTFHTIVRNVLGPEESDTEEKLEDLQQNLNCISRTYEEEHEEDAEPMLLSSDVLKKALSEVRIPEEKAERIRQFTEESFSDQLPSVDSLLDKKAVTAGEIRAEKQALQDALDEKTREVSALKTKMEEHSEETDSDETAYAVQLKTDEETAEDIQIREINGQNYLLVPVPEDARILVNGEEL